MTKKDKALEKLRQNQKNVRFEELVAVLLALGFEMKEGGKGSHVVFKIPGQPPLTVPRQKPFLKPIYVKMALEIITTLADDTGSFVTPGGDVE
jgi:predicted RNA binding protein YcfA (HicA-like mRNA interferase family)